MATEFLFSGQDTNSQGQLWVSDGTARGTHVVAVPNVPYGTNSPYYLTTYDGLVYFNTDGALWTTDGTAAGTTPFVEPGHSGLVSGESLVVSGKNLFLTINSVVNQLELSNLYVSIAGAVPVPVPLSGGSPFYYVGFTAPYENGVVFYGSDGVYYSGGGGVVALVTSASGIPNVQYNVYGPPIVPVAFGDNRLLVSGFDDALGENLYVFNGNTQKAQQLYIPGLSPGGPRTQFGFAWGNRVVFDAMTASNHDDLFVSDGTTGGTRDISTAVAGFASAVESSIVFKGMLLVAGRNAAQRAVLLLTDGTQGGTTLLATLGDPADDFSLVKQPLTGQQSIVVGDAAYFAATVAGTGVLWRSDGTAAGTFELHITGAGDNPHTSFSPSNFAALAPAHTLYGDLGGRSTVVGTLDDDEITTYGASNVIDGNGGSDTITTGIGGYSRVVEGSPGDGVSGRTTITLNGRGNAVSGGDEDFLVTGGTGFSGVTLGSGNNTVTLGGDYNAVTAGLGRNVIDAGGGFSKVTVTQSFTGADYDDDTVKFSGTHDELDVSNLRGTFRGVFHVSGGSGDGKFTIANGTLVTDGLSNVVRALPGTSDVTIGSGYDTLSLEHSYLGEANTMAHLAGTHNLVEGSAGTLVATGGSGSSRYLFDHGARFVGGPPAKETYTLATDGLYNRFALVDTDSNTVTAGSGYDSVTILDPSILLGTGDQPSTLTYAASTVTFAGTDNALTAGNGPITATGGTGQSTYVLGDGDDTITTGGLDNRITLGSGTDHVTAGSGRAVVVLNGSNASVVLQGGGNAVFLNAGASGMIGGGASPDLHIHVAPGIGREVVDGLAADPRAIVDLSGGAGGYASAAQVVAALAPDGAGGTLLPVGTGALDFAAVAPGAIHAGMFVIG